MPKSFPKSVPAKHVAVIGGGLAGLAAAASLAAKGIQTTLIEASGQLGGRARTVAINRDDETLQLDNGQHILLGAYRETLKLLALVGVSEKDVFLRVPLHLDMREGNKNIFKLSAWQHLPMPFNQLFGFLFCQGLSFKERFNVIRMMISLQKSNYRLNKDITLGDFLTQHHQSPHVIKCLWEPLCLAALNTPMLVASSVIFLNVLRDTFGSKHSTDFLLAKFDLSHILSQPIAQFLYAKNVHIACQQRVRQIHLTDTGFRVETDHTTQHFSHVVIAVDAPRLKDISKNLAKLDVITAAIQPYDYQPIYTIYLQYEKHITINQAMVGLSNSMSQWVFDRGILCGQPGLMAVIISAQGAHQQYSQSSIAEIVAAELQLAFASLQKPLWHKVIAEKRATFSCTVGITRPPQQTTYPNLYLAGDYTYANYPATIEGAVRSGVICADLISR